MITRKLPATAALLGAIVLSMTLAGQPALAQPSCPCFTSALIDGWFAEQGVFETGSGQSVSCADDPGLTTFDYFDRQVPGPSVLAAFIDVLDSSAGGLTRCVVDLTEPGGTQAEAEITNAEANSCRSAILQSQAWTFFACPKL